MKVRSTRKQIGGCKEGAKETDQNAKMFCKTECDLVESNVKGFNWIFHTAKSFLAKITVNAVYNAAEKPYVGLLQLRGEFCSRSLLR